MSLSFIESFKQKVWDYAQYYLGTECSKADLLCRLTDYFGYERKHLPQFAIDGLNWIREKTGVSPEVASVVIILYAAYKYNQSAKAAAALKQLTLEHDDLKAYVERNKPLIQKLQREADLSAIKDADYQPFVDNDSDTDSSVDTRETVDTMLQLTHVTPVPSEQTQMQALVEFMNSQQLQQKEMSATVASLQAQMQTLTTLVQANQGLESSKQTAITQLQKQMTVSLQQLQALQANPEVQILRDKVQALESTIAQTSRQIDVDSLNMTIEKLQAQVQALAQKPLEARVETQDAEIKTLQNDLVQLLILLSKFETQVTEQIDLAYSKSQLPQGPLYSEPAEFADDEEVVATPAATLAINPVEDLQTKVQVLIDQVAALQAAPEAEKAHVAVMHEQMQSMQSFLLAQQEHQIIANTNFATEIGGLQKQMNRLVKATNISSEEVQALQTALTALETQGLEIEEIKSFAGELRTALIKFEQAVANQIEFGQAQVLSQIAPPLTYHPFNPSAGGYGDSDSDDILFMPGPITLGKP